MKMRVLITFLIVFVALFCFGHGGGTDREGGHYNHISGGYHYHHGQGPHQHPDGICPYEENSKPSGGNSSSSTVWYVIGGMVVVAIAVKRLR
jgi:hypothetical protein